MAQCWWTYTHLLTYSLTYDLQYDIFNIGKLGLVSAIGDLPLLGVFAYVFEDVRKSGPDYEKFEDAVISLAIAACVLHMMAYASRGVIFVLTSGLRRKNEGSFYSYLPNFGDGLTSLVGLVQFFVVILLIVTFDAGSHDGLTKQEDQQHMHNCVRVLAITLGINMLCNFMAVCSFLNHWVFSHEQLTDRPFASGLVVCLGVFDVSFLDLLSNDEQHDKDVKYAATSTHACDPTSTLSLRPLHLACNHMHLACNPTHLSLRPHAPQVRRHDHRPLDTARAQSTRADRHHHGYQGRPQRPHPNPSPPKC